MFGVFFSLNIHHMMLAKASYVPPTGPKHFFLLFLSVYSSHHSTLHCFVLCLQALYKGAPRVILATENDYCKLCDASFSSPAVAQAHYQGKNHAKKLRLAEAQQNSNNM